MGDFVRVIGNEIVPADLLLLHTSDPKGVCLIETANLDGETNLKQRRAVSGLCITVGKIYFIFFFHNVCVLFVSALPHTLLSDTETHYQ